MMMMICCLPVFPLVVVGEFRKTKVFIVYRRVINLVMNLLHFIVVFGSVFSLPSFIQNGRNHLFIVVGK